MENRYVPLCKGNYCMGNAGDSRTWFRRLMMALNLENIEAMVSRCDNHMELLVPREDYYRAFVKANHFVNNYAFVGMDSFVMPFDSENVDKYNFTTSKNIVTPKDVDGQFAFRDNSERIALCSSLYYASNGRLDTKWHFKKLRDMLRSHNIQASVSRVGKHMEMVVPSADYYDAFNLTYDYLQKARVFGFHAFVTPFDKEMVDHAKDSKDISLITPEQVKSSGLHIRDKNTKPKYFEKDEM